MALRLGLEQPLPEHIYIVELRLGTRHSGDLVVCVCVCGVGLTSLGNDRFDTSTDAPFMLSNSGAVPSVAGADCLLQEATSKLHQVPWRHACL